MKKIFMVASLSFYAINSLLSQDITYLCNQCNTMTDTLSKTQAALNQQKEHVTQSLNQVAQQTIAAQFPQPEDLLTAAQRAAKQGLQATFETQLKATLTSIDQRIEALKKQAATACQQCKAALNQAKKVTESAKK